jgi:hypothetical protein
MPFKDPDKRRLASRMSMRKKRLSALQAAGDAGDYKARRAAFITITARRMHETVADTRKRLAILEAFRRDEPAALEAYRRMEVDPDFSLNRAYRMIGKIAQFRSLIGEEGWARSIEGTKWADPVDEGLTKQ